MNTLFLYWGILMFPILLLTLRVVRMNKEEDISEIISDNEKLSMMKSPPPILTKRVLYSAAKLSLVVGTLLNVMNQWECIMAGQGLMLSHVLMNYLVPFYVAAYSGAKAITFHNQNMLKEIDAANSKQGSTETA